MKDYYHLLGVEPAASEKEIKRAYKRLALEHHPDKHNGNADATRKFREITEAYTVLSDAEKRSRYDRFGSTKTISVDFSTSLWTDFSVVFVRDYPGDFGGRKHSPEKLRQWLDESAAYVKEKRRVWVDDREKRKKELTQRQSDLEVIIKQNGLARNAITRTYQWPAFGAALGSAILWYTDNLEYGIGAATVTTLLSVIAYVKKKPLREELNKLGKEYLENGGQLKGMAMVDDLVEKLK